MAFPVWALTSWTKALSWFAVALVFPSARELLAALSLAVRLLAMKSLDSYLPLGPWLVTGDEAGDAGDLGTGAQP